MGIQTIPVSPEHSLDIDQVGGDLAVQGWDRQELQASGDVVRMERGEHSITVRSGGDLSLSIPRGMRVLLGNVGGDVAMQGLMGDVELRLVGGDASLRDLSGQVHLNGVIGGETHMENVASVSVSTASKASDIDISDRIRRKIQQATDRADRKIRRAQEKLNRYHFDESRWKYNSGSDAPSAAPAGEPVSEEERMMILRMLQEKKITSEEADKLLSALEGGAD